MIFRTRPAPMRAARPTSPFPALLLTRVRSPTFVLFSSASISSTGWPASPKPPIMTVEPWVMHDTASSGVRQISSMSELRVLEDHGEALTDTDADGRYAVSDSLGFHATGQGGDQAAPRRAEGVAYGDCAAVRVDDLGIDGPLAEAGQALGSEGLVELDDADLVPADAGLGKRPVSRFDRRDAEQLRLHCRDAASTDAGEGLLTEQLRCLRAADEHG